MLRDEDLFYGRLLYDMDEFSYSLLLYVEYPPKPSFLVMFFGACLMDSDGVKTNCLASRETR